MRRWIELCFVLYLAVMLVGCAAASKSGVGKQELSPDDMAICPVCGKQVVKDPKLAVGYMGKRYWFCSKECLDRFREDPSQFVEEEE